MTGDSCNVGSKKTRPALCDMTNLPSKRGISSILGDLLFKSGEESGKTVVREDSGVKFSKRLCLVVEDLVKENSRGSDSDAVSSSFEDRNSSGGSPVDGDSENTESIVKNEPEEPKDASDALNIGIQSSKDNDVNAVVEISSGDGVVLKESCVSSSSVQTCLEFSEKDRGQALNMASNANQCDVTSEGIARSVLSSISESREVLVMGENKTTEVQRLPNSQSFRPFEMSRCSTVDRMGHVNLNMGADQLKSCSCSFCLKAAYIWSDLHYQDIKGRLSVLKKSQKQASNLIQRNSRGKLIEVHCSANSNSSAKLESDLMAQWRSLFLGMEGIMARESNHLQKSFVTMKELRDNCKMDLERATKTPQR